MVRVSFVLLLAAWPLASGLTMMDMVDPKDMVAFPGAQYSFDVKENVPPERYTFDAFVKTFKRPYRHGMAEWSKRWMIFQANLDKILTQRKRGGHTWQPGINNFMDWTEEEKF